MKRLFLILLITLFSISPFFAQEKSISDEEYFIQYTTMLNRTQKRLTYMNKKNAMAKVGTETIYGLKSGSLYYNVKIKGLGAVVTLHYENYADEDGWLFDGDIITTSNMAQNGTLDGAITVKGDCPGTVYYDKVILKDGKPGDGTYGVKQEGNERTEVSYKLYFEAEN